VGFGGLFFITLTTLLPEAFFDTLSWLQRTKYWKKLYVGVLIIFGALFRVGVGTTYGCRGKHLVGSSVGGRQGGFVALYGSTFKGSTGDFERLSNP